MQQAPGTTNLPKKRTDRFICWVEGTNTARLIVIAVLSYVATAMLFSFVFFVSSKQGCPLIFNECEPVEGYLETVYFNFITILTVGYGDLHPVGAGRYLAVIEALIGIGLFGTVIGVVIIKLTTPSKQSIVFSKYGYYDKSVSRFFILFVNTNRTPFITVELSSILKIERNNVVETGSNVPYIGESVWLFYLHELGPDKIKRSKLYPDDGLKFGLSGNYGFTRFATAMKYSFDEILVIPDSSGIAHIDLVLNPIFGSTEFEKLFHYEPEGAITFNDYVKELHSESV